MNAPRALPTWSGPVGLADTNSTLTERGRTGATRPQPGGSARMDAIVDSSAASRRRTFRKPGGATSADAIGEAEPVAGRLCIQLGGDGGRDRQRRHPVRAGKPHRQVAREVTVDGVGRAFDGDVGSGGVRQATRATRRPRRPDPMRARPPLGRRCGSASGWRGAGR